MGERKVLNKYYPPDFDPAILRRLPKTEKKQIKVRMMLPMSIRCNTCGNYIYKGTKFNSRKEDVVGKTYLGIQIFRFYFKCTKCSAELAMVTDPQNSDYVMESGAKRNFEPWREQDEAMENAKKQREIDEMGDAMKALENKTVDSKQEMDIMAALDEMKSMRARHAQVDTAAMLEVLQRTAAANMQKRIDEEDEEILRSVVFRNSEGYVKRLMDDEDDDEDEPRKKQNVETNPVPKPPLPAAAKKASGGPKFIIKPVEKSIKPVEKSNVSSAAPQANGALSSLGAYASDDDDDEE
ncbi:coiled-coil domain-containing protein 94 homolog [Selaginella moellendorffii]|uniref:coiled-coil domain-containing protein 94 homolog n=1 Tax=Selaginella moellendorffii TaxID=88036 RepID=UPI000D1C845D|nr:coiled-coil domain-containing protein 94 homolog [Selaginella moellendorffii]|eukprot:XP_002960592.2 coiled-coil domain-containing protein 94 homolog [Selaginella moellendorffii]